MNHVLGGWGTITGSIGWQQQVIVSGSLTLGHYYDDA
jgi:hypothetical protein